MERPRVILLVLFVTLNAFLLDCRKGSSSSLLNIELEGLDGKTYDLTGVKGDLILVNFWATWCPPCREEIPELVKLRDGYEGKGLGIVGISMDRGDTRKIKEFALKWNIDYPVFRGGREVVQKYGGLSGLPVSFLIDRGGDIRKVYYGSLNKETVEKDLKLLLKQ